MRTAIFVIVVLTVGLLGGCRPVETGGPAEPDKGQAIETHRKGFSINDILLNNRDMVFYGRMLDFETGNPVEGGKVNIHYDSYKVLLSGQPGFDIHTTDLTTDTNGLFVFRGKGYSFSIQDIKKDGYYCQKPPMAKNHQRYDDTSPKLGIDVTQPVTFFMLRKAIPGVEKGGEGYKEIKLLENERQEALLSVYPDFANRYAICQKSYQSKDFMLRLPKYLGDFSDLPENRMTPLRSELVGDYLKKVDGGEPPVFSKNELWDSEVKLDIEPMANGYRITLKSLNRDGGFCLMDNLSWVAPEEGYQGELSFVVEDKGFQRSTILGQGAGSVYDLDLDRSTLDVKHVCLRDGGGNYPVYGRIWFYVGEVKTKVLTEGKYEPVHWKSLYIEYGVNRLGYRFLGKDYDDSYINLSGSLVKQAIKNRQSKGGINGIQLMPEWVKLSDAELKAMVEEEVEKKYLEAENNKNDKYELSRQKQRAFRLKKTEKETLLARKYWTEEDERKFREECDRAVQEGMVQWLNQQEGLKDQIPEEFRVKVEQYNSHFEPRSRLRRVTKGHEGGKEGGRL